MVESIRVSSWFCAALAALLLLVAGCGGGSGGGVAAGPVAGGPENGSGTATGTLEIALTDAEGEFARYRVRVEALRLMAENGDAVTVPLGLDVDFTELLELTELLTAVEVPAGRYRNLSLTFDFADAEVVLQEADGSLLDATLEDGDGAAPGVVEVEIELAENGSLDVTAEGTRRLTLDFDLGLSNARHPMAPTRVVVTPVVLALSELEAGRPHRVRGLLRQVDVSAGVVGLDTRPFGQAPISSGALRFRVDADTHYLIDGEPLRGQIGLEALAEQEAGTPVAALGGVIDGVLLAERVLVGDSVPGARGDSVRGVVLARDGKRILLGGAVAQRPAARDRFERRWLLDVGPGTAVALPRGELVVGAEAISVGSRLQAFGILGETVLGTPLLDASEGRVQLHVTGLTAEVRSLEPFAVELLLLAGRQPGAFDFTGTGLSAEDDADPSAYLIAGEAAITAEPEVGQLVRARGRVQDFGVAPPDFIAFQLEDAAVGARRAVLQAQWAPPGSTMAFVGIGNDRIGLDLSDARALLRVAGIERDLLPSDGLIGVVAADVAAPIFVLAARGPGGGQRQFDDFADFAAALLEVHESGRSLLRLGMQGSYNPADSTFGAARLQVVFAPAQLP